MKMSIDEAIEHGKEQLEIFGGEHKEFIEMAIKALEQEPFINKPCISSGVCEHDKQKVLEKIRAEIERKAHSGQWSDATMYGMLKAVAIIDKYKADRSEEDEKQKGN